MKHHHFLSLLFLLNACGQEPPQDVKESKSTAQNISVTLTEGTNLAVAISPDGKQFVLDLQGTLWTMSAAGGEARAITDKYGDTRQPSWSPDGQEICFQGYWEGNWHIYRINNKEGAEAQQLTSGRFDHREPHWSRAGDKIAFSSDQSGNYDIWTIDVHTGDLEQLTDTDTHDEYGPCYSSGGDRIAFVAKQGSEHIIQEIDLATHAKSEIYRTEDQIFGLGYDPRQEHLLFNSLNGMESHLNRLDLAARSIQPIVISDVDEDIFPFRPTWISDEEFVYTGTGKIWKGNLRTQQKSEIHFAATVKLDRPSYTLKQRNFDLDEPQNVKGIYQPVISPDGNSVAFIALADVWITNLDGGSIRVSEDHSIQVAPAWSNDGTRLAFASDHLGTTAIWIYDLQKRASSMLGQTAGMPIGIDWSSDDAQLAYTLNYGPRSGLLWKMSVKSGESQRVGHNFPYSVSGPSWSHDHQHIALSVLHPYSDLYREGINRIVVAKADGSATLSPQAQTHQSFGMRGNDGPNWSPDGSMLAFLSQGFLWIADVDTRGNFIGEPRKMTTDLSDSPSWTADSKAVLYQHNEVLRVINVQTGETNAFDIDLTWQPSVDTSTKVIHAGGLFDGLTNRIQRDKDIIIRGNRITGIEDHDPDRATDSIIDASNLYVTPGLIDIHAHQASEMGEILGRRWLAWGVTSTRDPATNPYDALNRREAMHAGTLTYPRIFFTGSPLDGNRVYYGGTYALQNKRQLEMELARAKVLEYDMIKTYVRLPDTWQQEVVSKAHELGIPVSSHELYPAASYGVDAVEHIMGTSRRGYSPKMSRILNAYGDVTQLIAKSGIRFTPTISIYVGYNYMLAQDPLILDDPRLQKLEPELTKTTARQNIEAVKNNPSYWNRQFANAAKMIKDVHDQGGRVVAGTDSPIIPFGFGLHIELESYQQAGMTPFAVMQTTTLHAAEGIGIDDHLGSIEVGKLADLLIVGSNPLDDIRNLRDLQSVVLNGKIISISDLLQ
ncbi:MAG: amidohydrolase family protein [Saprospiraceae bacterium]|nr:amidohydrolase family protein [Saprospiraceae bacterium]